jgi:hypothetical protein
LIRTERGTQMTREQINQLLTDCEHLIAQKEKELREFRAAAADLHAALDDRQRPIPDRSAISRGPEVSHPLSLEESQLRVTARPRRRSHE